MNEGDLTPKQGEVVDADDSVVLVFGGAGCGKTTVALWAARSELARHPASWVRVGFLTFSRTAVDQIGQRCRSAVSGIRDRVEISTFHGFSYRLLRSFGRYAGFGPVLPALQSPAEERLHGRRPELLRYDDLLPSAIQVLESRVVRDLVAARWPLVICDEFQDTSDEQWELLQILGAKSRLLLLADPHQMIYTFLPGVGPERLRRAEELATRVVELESASHRDPSGAIPALADAVRRRDFESPAVRSALDGSGLVVRSDVDDEALVEVIADELRAAWRSGATSFGIFGHSNEGVARLAHGLHEAGVDHVLIGLPDAQGEALVAMATLCGYALGTHDEPDIRQALATFLTACSRGRGAPNLAVALNAGHRIPDALSDRLDVLQKRLKEEAGDTEALAEVIADAWEGLGILAGLRPWARAVPAFASLLRRAARSPDEVELMGHLEREVRALRTGALLDTSRTRLPPTQLMNFHQTKGREADAVVLVYRDGDYLADRYATEPFEDASRVLYVAMTRARHRVVVVTPPEPHALIAPLAALAG